MIINMSVRQEEKMKEFDCMRKEATSNIINCIINLKV